MTIERLLDARAARVACRWLSAALVAFMVAACGGGGGGGVDVDDEEPPPPAPGGSGTGANGTPVFWKVFGYNVAYGRAHAVAETPDGGFVAAGFQSVSGAPNEVHVVKTDRAGATVWERRIPVGGGAITYAVRPLGAGGYMLAGTIGDGPTARAFMMQLDAGGNLVSGWPKIFGDPGTTVLAMLAVNGGTDGFLLGGVSGSRPHVLRVDAAGQVLWAKSDYANFCAGGGAIVAAIAPTSDGRYVLAGRTGCFEWAGFLLKIEASNGRELWRRTWDDDNASHYAGFDAVHEAPDGALLAAGRVGGQCVVGGAAGQCDMLLVKTDADGGLLWTRRYGGAQVDGAAGVVSTADGNYLVAGTTRSYGGPITDAANAFMWDDLMLVKVTPGGATAWQRVKGVRPRAIDQAMAMARVSDGGFVVAGESGGNVLLVKFDANGGTVDLGPNYDLTISVPTTSGAVNFDNAVEVAGLGASALLMPAQLGGQLVDLLIAAAAGEPPATYCSGGGSYAFAPAVPSALAAGSSYTLTFNQCQAGPADDTVRLQGSLTLTVTAVSGTPGADNYGARVSLGSIALTADEPGTSPLLAQTFAGSMAVERTVSAGLADDVISAAAGGTLAYTDSSGGTVTHSATLGPFAIHATQGVDGMLRVGAAGDSATVAAGGSAWGVTVLQPLALPASTLDVTAGSYRVAGPDGSRLTVSVSAAGGTSSATLAIDTDGDGHDDGSLSMPWEFIF